MDTDGKDVNGDSSGAATETVSEAPDQQEVDGKITQEESSANEVHSFKECVEILSVEVVQSPADVQHNNDQIAVTDMENVEANKESEQSEKDNEDGADYINKQEVLCGNTAGKDHGTLPDINSCPPNFIASEDSFTNSIAIDGENKTDGAKENQESRDCQNNTDTEDTSTKDTIEENITISDMRKNSEELYQSVEDTNISVSPTNKEMGEIVEISENISTTADILEMSDVHDKFIDTSVTQNETIETNTTINSTTGLSLLAQYGSDNEDNDSDSDSVIEVSTSNQDYRNRIVEIDSDSDSSSSDSDVEYLNKIRKTIEKRMEVDDDDEDDDEAENGNGQTGIRKKPKPKVKAKGELHLDDLPPIQDLQITVTEDECIVLGKIHSIVDQLVLVAALPDSILVDLETVLFLDKGQKVLGEVFDVLGQVADPLYCVRFNSNKQINEKNIQVNDVVYLAPKTQYTQYIILSSIMKQKGSDASWENDLEPPPRFLDYSDDEQQQQARRQMRNKDRPVDNDDQQKRPRRDSEEPQVSSCSRAYSSQPRQRYPSSTRGSGPPNRGSYGRPHQQFNSQYRHPQIPSNHNPGSWHSNYYPPAYAAMSPPNVPYGSVYQRMPQQTYPQVPVYPMGIPYPPPPPYQHAGPPNNHPAEHHRFMPNAFNMRPPTIPGHFDTSTPPPGSQ